MYIPLKRMVHMVLVVVCATVVSEAREFPPGQQGPKEKIAILPFAQKGLSSEETARITSAFSEALKKSEKFDIMPHADVLRTLDETNFKNLETCNYSFCLSDVGKVLGVQKVLYGSVIRRGRLYTISIRFVDVTAAKIVYEKNFEHSGEFDQLCLEVLPNEARALADYSLEHSTRWYVVTAAVLVMVGAIYSIYKAFNKNTATDTPGGSAPPTTQ